MILFDGEESLLRALEEFSAQNKHCLGLVSLDVPLISNLDVWINIALIRQYHHNLSRREAENEVRKYLGRYDLEKIANKRSPALTSQERFLVMLLRAAMVADAKIVIDRPFRIMPELQNGRFIFDSVAVIRGLYREIRIFDYGWFESRYRMSDAT